MLVDYVLLNCCNGLFLLSDDEGEIFPEISLDESFVPL